MMTKARSLIEKLKGGEGFDYKADVSRAISDRFEIEGSVRFDRNDGKHNRGLVDIGFTLPDVDPISDKVYIPLDIDLYYDTEDGVVGAEVSAKIDLVKQYYSAEDGELKDFASEDAKNKTIAYLKEHEEELERHLRYFFEDYLDAIFTREAENY